MRQLLFDEIFERDVAEFSAIKDRLASGAVRLAFLQRFLLGFISAHPSRAAGSEKTRVKQAMTALLGKCPPNLHPTVSDELLLAEMADLYRADRTNHSVDRKPRSVAQLARTVTRTRKEYSAQVERLRAKFASRKSELLSALEDDEGLPIEQLVRTALYDLETLMSHFQVRFFAEK